MAALALCAALPGCSPDLRLSNPSRLCVELPAGHVTDEVDFEQTVIAGLDRTLTEVGYAWSTQSLEQNDLWSYNWYVLEPVRGSGRPRNQVGATYAANREKYGMACDLRVDIHADRWRAHGAFEWRTYYHLRDTVLPTLMPGAEVSVLEHPGLRTRAWDVPSLAARFAEGEALPEEVRERVDAYEKRWAVGRWWERSATATWTAWERTGGTHVSGAALYFAFPPNWAAFAAFAIAVLAGRWLVRSRAWRTVGFVALAVVLLMPVKVPTLVGTVYMPHGFVQAYDFDPTYYAREPLFALAAALLTAALAWLLLRLVRRSSGGSARS